jgi:hypothetical protein
MSVNKNALNLMGSSLFTVTNKVDDAIYDYLENAIGAKQAVSEIREAINEYNDKNNLPVKFKFVEKGTTYTADEIINLIISGDLENTDEFEDLQNGKDHFEPIVEESKKKKKRFTKKMEENIKKKNRKLREHKVLKEEISRENVQKAMQFVNKNCKLEIDGNDPDEGEGKYGGEFTCELGEGPFLIGSEGNYDIYLKDPVFYGEFEAEVKIERDVPGTPPGEYRPTDPPTEERILQGIEIDDAGLDGVVFKLSSDKSENAPGDISLEDTDDYVNLEEYSESDLRNIAEKQFDSFKEMIEVEYAEEHNLDL